MPKPVPLTRVNLALDAKRLSDIADWIDQRVGFGTDEAEQLRTVGVTLQRLADERRRRTKPAREDRAFGTHLRKAREILRGT